MHPFAIRERDQAVALVRNFTASPTVRIVSAAS
jgi:hypothetical protein